VSRASRTAPCSSREASKRAAIALAYLETAEAVMAERPELREEHLSVAAGAAVLAGVAASDAICGRRLGKIHRGEDHRGAIDLLRSAIPDGREMAAKLARLLDTKDEAHYGIRIVSRRRASDALRWARALVERARRETER